MLLFSVLAVNSDQFQTRDRHNMLLLFYAQIPVGTTYYALHIMLESMIDINAEKRLETISQCHRFWIIQSLRT